MISSDRKSLELHSAVSKRMKMYGELVEELHIILLSDSKHGLKETKIGSNVWVYPTNSITSFLRPVDAARLGKKVVFEKKFVRGQSLITADSVECGWAGLRIKNKWRIPIEIQIHTDPFSPYFKGFQNTVRKIFMKKILREADSVRVVTSNLKSIISQFTSADVKVLPIYVDKERIEDEPIIFDLHARYLWHFIFLTVSRLTPEKNLEFTLEILAKVRAQFPDTGLVIVGSGPEESRLKTIIKKLKLESAVEFVGWQNNLASFYKTANVFIQTSFFEGYGMSLVEAGLSGLPIITTPVGVALELEHGKDAYIYPFGRIDLFANGIIDLIENNYKRENLKTNIKHTLGNKLLSKEEYLSTLQSTWNDVARKLVYQD